MSFILTTIAIAVSMINSARVMATVDAEVPHTIEVQPTDYVSHNQWLIQAYDVQESRLEAMSRIA